MGVLKQVHELLLKLGARDTPSRVERIDATGGTVCVARRNRRSATPPPVAWAVAGTSPPVAVVDAAPLRVSDLPVGGHVVESLTVAAVDGLCVVSFAAVRVAVDFSDGTPDGRHLSIFDPNTGETL